MPYKTGSWGEQARERAKKRNKYFFEYNKFRDIKKKKARRAVELAIKCGKLKILPCRDCESVKVQAHHPNYEDQLSVIWVCPKHHRIIHGMKS